jgi:hypothetical protein
LPVANRTVKPFRPIVTLSARVFAASCRPTTSSKYGMALALRAALAASARLAERIAALPFLWYLKFLEDRSVRDIKSDPELFQKHCVESNFKRIEVRDFAAMRIAIMLDLEVNPEPQWTAGDWTKLRTQVREALELEGIKP